MNLSGNTILITGGSAGIGLAFAKEFVAGGNTVIVTGRRQEKLDEAKEAVPELHTLQSDVADTAQIKALAERIRADFPALNVLMNNAGIFLYKNLAGKIDDLDGLTRELDINVAGTLRTTSALMDVLVKNQGTIINVSSGLAFVPLTCAPIYCATKAALHSYSTSLRFQLAPAGVEVIELMPPAVKTDLTADLPEDGAFKLMTTEQLVKATWKGFRSGATEIRPGQANQLHWMSRIAPGFINGELYKGSKALIPPLD